MFDVDPGRWPGDTTSIRMTFCHTPAATTADLHPAYHTFTAVRPRRDGLGHRHHGSVPAHAAR